MDRLPHRMIDKITNNVFLHIKTSSLPNPYNFMK
jgi:hypothetical protein